MTASERVISSRRMRLLRSPSFSGFPRPPIPDLPRGARPGFIPQGRNATGLNKTVANALPITLPTPPDHATRACRLARNHLPATDDRICASREFALDLIPRAEMGKVKILPFHRIRRRKHPMANIDTTTSHAVGWRSYKSRKRHLLHLQCALGLRMVGHRSVGQSGKILSADWKINRLSVRLKDQSACPKDCQR